MNEFFSAVQWQLIATHSLRIAAILVVAWILQAIASRLIRVFRAYMARRLTSIDENRRVATLEQVIRYVATVVIAIVAGSLVLNELGISVAPILATAGVAGVAIGFGAQSLVKDYFTGFFLLIEDQIRQGDVVQIGDRAGVVEEVTLRYVRLRDGEAHVHYIPNGEIRVLTNRTRDYARVLVDISVSLEENLDNVYSALRAAGASLRADPAFAGHISDDLKVEGVERLTDSGALVRCSMRVVPPGEQWTVKRELLRRIKNEFGARGVASPINRMYVHSGDGTPAAQALAAPATAAPASGSPQRPG